MTFKDVMTKSREALLGWLQRNDPNGIWLDKDYIEEFGKDAPLPNIDYIREEVFHALAVGTDYVRPGKAPTFDQLVAAYIRTAVDEIGADIRSKKVPQKVRSFGELHDYVDANMYGGSALLQELYGMDREFVTDVLNVGGAAVDMWLRAGHINSAHQTYE